MYYYPFLLLTEDDIRNGTIADLLEDDMLDTLAERKTLYESLPENFPKRALHDLADIQLTMNKVLCETLRSNMNVLKQPLTDIDNWRIKDKLKRCLTMMRRKCADIFHTYDNYTFSDLLRKTELWEDHPVFKGLHKPAEWNIVFLNRISDIHRHMSRLVEVLEPKLLLKDVMLKKEKDTSPSLSTPAKAFVSNVPVAVAATDDTALMDSTAKILEGCRYIHREVKDYIRLVDSL